MRLASVVIVVALLLGSPPVLGAPAVGDCGPKDPARARAAAALAALEGRMSSLASPAELVATAAALGALLEDKCLKLAAFEAPSDNFWSEPLDPRALTSWDVATVRAWWDDGGRDWLRGHLEPRPGIALFPPTLAPRPPRGDAPTEGPRIPAALLCRDGEPGCGAGLGGWVARAKAVFAAGIGMGDPPDEQDKAIEACAREAARDKPSERYRSWWQCVDGASRRVGQLPVGGMRRPERGWLMLRGRRGHYGFCDGVWAYDLATGAAFQVESCGGLALVEGGQVDAAATNGSRRLRAERGRVSVDNLREAAWMILVEPVVARGRPELLERRIPAGLRPRLPDDGVVGGVSGTVSWSSAQTVLDWVWGDGDTVLAEGRLVWPTSDQPGEAHAASLLTVAEQGFIAGCAPAAPPDQPWARRSGMKVSAIDAPAGTDATSLQLADALMRLRGEPACPGGSRP